MYYNAIIWKIIYMALNSYIEIFYNCDILVKCFYGMTW